MATLDYRTAGESHGPGLIVLIEGMPACVALDVPAINTELRRRQGGYGRGGRMAIERDEVRIVSGVRRGETIGSPIAMEIINRDSRIDDAPPVHRPRPGHADLAGSIKWLTTDCRSTLERASARETAARVAAGATAKCLLNQFGVVVVGFVRRIFDVAATIDATWTPQEITARRDSNEVYCPDSTVADAMIESILAAKKAKDTLGGVVEVQVHGLPVGIGSCARWQDKLDGRLMGAVGSIQAIKAVEIGMGFGVAERRGSDVHDALGFEASRCDTPSLGFTRASNNAGGLEGGMSNGQPIVIRAAMKPISTLLMGMDSVNLETRAPERSDYERSDVCSVPAASVVAENVVAFEIARAFTGKFGGDTLAEVRAAYEFHQSAARSLGTRTTPGTAG